MVDINDASSYKRCKGKVYQFHCCMPARGTVVVNKLVSVKDFLTPVEFSLYYQLFGSKAYIMVGEFNNLPQDVQTFVAHLCEYGVCSVTTDEKPYVVCGSVGELYVVSFKELQRMAEVGTVKKASLDKRMNFNGQMDWISLKSKLDKMSILFACFVPLEQRVILNDIQCNVLGTAHGFGDFIVCRSTNIGDPDLTQRWVVPGEVFARTYSKLGWANCVVEDNGLAYPLPPLCDEVGAVEYEHALSYAVDDFYSRTSGWDGIIQMLPFRKCKDKDGFLSAVSAVEFVGDKVYYIHFNLVMSASYVYIRVCIKDSSDKLEKEHFGVSLLRKGKKTTREYVLKQLLDGFRHTKIMVSAKKEVYCMEVLKAVEARLGVSLQLSDSYGGYYRYRSIDGRLGVVLYSRDGAMIAVCEKQGVKSNPIICGMDNVLEMAQSIVRELV